MPRKKKSKIKLAESAMKMRLLKAIKKSLQSKGEHPSTSADNIDSIQFRPHQADSGRPRLSGNVEERVLDYFGDNPHASTRAAGRKLRISHVNAWNVLNENEQHPEHVLRELYPLDEKLEVAPGTSSENVELDLLDENVEDAPGTSSQNVNQDSSSNGIEINVFCPKCNTEVPHTAQGIQEDQTKILVAKVYHYFEQEYEEFKTIYGDLDLTPLSKFRERTALATGVSELMVLAILQEEEKRNAEKRQEPPGERRRTRKRSRHIKSIREEDSSNDNVDDGGQPSYYLQPNIESEIETLVVKIEPPESYMEQTHYDPISTEVKAEPPDDDVNNTNETLAFTEPTGTKRNGRKKSRSDVTSTWQHSQGESSTAAASTSVRLTAELDESGLLQDTEVKMENVEIGGEGFS